MSKVVIIGGGWAGVSAAISAKKAGAQVTIIERTDMLLGLGNVGGIMRNNGRHTAAEENILLGNWELFEITDRVSTHKKLDFPGHKHANLYDVSRVEPEVRKLLKEMDIEIKLKSRAINIEMKENKIIGIILQNDEIIYGDVFVETTGSAGGMGNCSKYGNGCAMCILRCPTFGPRVSISAKTGNEDQMGERNDGTCGAFSGSCKLNKESLSDEVRKELDEKGVVVLPVNEDDINMNKLDIKVCQQYALKEYAQNVILLDTGHAKLMSPYYPLDKLRKIKGLENARYEDPYSGGIGNSIRYLSIAQRDNFMRVLNVDNLLCGGEKSGLFVGHTEAITTGALAGHNSVRLICGLPLLKLPTNIAIGDIISHENHMRNSVNGLRKRYTFAGSIYFERMKMLGLYILNEDMLKNKIEKLGLLNIYDEKIL
ncbi:FAD-dependent oxidoreductase [Anaeromicrobium sediminis]|uniref:FAD-dependent oxidoreductase n=1 Tax=Anaeromicrobium sediminis TaxID=1478221 RepID=A0A267MNJ9_9FIRM|nr:FAD-dependent oxidoreductase [Anaeromicrobium sediminis]PAB61191.1 FAD-dependent oxidoreductase [Anaeromicrobium sediminis]